MAVSLEVELKEPSNGQPHLFILGAGASRAALPNGDRFGRQVPLLNELTKTLGLDRLLAKHEIQAEDQDFEALYSDLHTSNPDDPLLLELESLVRVYFAELELPQESTIYDYLILSLREKDFVATFNWDPFLLQAAMRNSRATSHPRLAFLHGCAILGICDDHKLKAPMPGRCTKCDKELRPSRLLFPVKDKDYDTDLHISGEWSGLEAALRNAYVLTIFGFGAPVTDVKAVAIMQNAWSEPGERALEETEIIDIKPSEDLKAKWDPFIVGSHYRIVDDFFKSLVAKFPRRSCETIWNQFMLLKIPVENRAPWEVQLTDLQQWFQPLIDKENGISA